MSIDPRGYATEPLIATAPLPVISRRALRRVKDPVQIPVMCPHCYSRVRLVNNNVIYNGRSYGDWPFVYLCMGANCRAYIGLHPGTDIPLGTLADKPTREARIAGKTPFNDIWRDLITRKEAYAWLAKAMSIEPEACHFGLFNIEQSRKARDLCNAYLAAHHPSKGARSHA